MKLMSRAPMTGIDPSDGKEYEYMLEYYTSFHETGSYLYKFSRSTYPIDVETNRQTPMATEDLSILIKVFECSESELNKICENPGAYWYYYWNLHNHYQPKTIYCKFGRDDKLKYMVEKYCPNPRETFNKVLEMYDVNDGYKLFGFPMPTEAGDDKMMGWGPIFKINIWTQINKSVGESETLIEEMRQWIKEYVDNLHDIDEGGEDNA